MTELSRPVWRRFARWFVRQDLFEKAAWPASWVMILTIALTTAGGVISAVLPFATRRVSLERLQANPLARCVWARDADFANRFEKDDLARFEAELRRRLLHPEHLSACHPFRTVRFEWYFADGKSTWKHLGLTLDANDQLFRQPSQQFLFRSGSPFTSPQQRGVIVSPALLEYLQYPPDLEPGSMLKIQAPHSGVPIEIPLVGVTHDPLPLGHFFIINDLEYIRLVTEDPDPSDSTIITGPIHPDWPKNPKKLGPAATACLKNWGWVAYARQQDDKNCYRFSLDKEEQQSRSLWQGYLGQLHKAIIQDGAVPHDEFVFVRMRATESKETPTLEPLAWVGAYVESMEALRPTVKGLRDGGCVTTETGLAQMEEVSRSFRMAITVLWGLMVLFCLATAISFYSVHSLRAQQKAAQIGMMRALGMTDRQLKQLFLMEASLLWRRGTLLGLLVSAVLLAPLAYFFLRPGELTAVVLDWSLPGVAVFLVLSWLWSRFTAAASTRRLRSQAPISSLALTS